VPRIYHYASCSHQYVLFATKINCATALIPIPVLHCPAKRIYTANTTFNSSMKQTVSGFFCSKIKLFNNEFKLGLNKTMFCQLDHLFVKQLPNWNDQTSPTKPHFCRCSDTSETNSAFNDCPNEIKHEIVDITTSTTPKTPTVTSKTPPCPPCYNVCNSTVAQVQNVSCAKCETTSPSIQLGPIGWTVNPELIFWMLVGVLVALFCIVIMLIALLCKKGGDARAFARNNAIRLDAIRRPSALTDGRMLNEIDAYDRF